MFPTMSWSPRLPLSSAHPCLDGLRDRVASALARAGLDRPEVTVQTVDRLERPGGPAKLRRFLPLDRPPAPLNSAR
jgi:hypothetical protein